MSFKQRETSSGQDWHLEDANCLQKDLRVQEFGCHEGAPGNLEGGRGKGAWPEPGNVWDPELRCPYTWQGFNLQWTSFIHPFTHSTTIPIKWLLGARHYSPWGPQILQILLSRILYLNRKLGYQQSIKIHCGKCCPHCGIAAHRQGLYMNLGGWEETSKVQVSNWHPVGPIWPADVFFLAHRGFFKLWISC